MRYLAFVAVLLLGLPVYAEQKTDTVNFDLGEGYAQVEATIIIQSKEDRRAPAVMVSISPADTNSITLKEVNGDIPRLKDTHGGIRIWSDGKTGNVCPKAALPACPGKTKYFGVLLSNSLTSARDVVTYTLYGRDGHFQVSLTTETTEPRKQEMSILSVKVPTYVMHKGSYGGVDNIAGFIHGIRTKNVVAMAGLPETYNTPLKLKLFKRSKSYKDLLSGIPKLRKAVLDGLMRFCHEVTLDNYDLKRKGFTVTSGLREGDHTLVVRGFGKSKALNESGFRNLLHSTEKAALAVEGYDKVGMCFRVTSMSTRVRKIPYKVNPVLLRLMSRQERRLIPKGMKTTFIEYRVEATHLILGGLNRPEIVYSINRGRIK
jgi:hypothetical protein